MRLAIYIIYNLVWLKLAVYVLTYLNVYINTFFIPNSFRWTEAGKLRDDLTWFGVSQFVISTVEAILLVGLVYLINKWYVRSFLKLNYENERTLFWTAVVGFGILFCWLCWYYYSIYK